MPYLLRVNVRPNESKLSDSERDHMLRIFDMHAAEVNLYGEAVGWDEIQEVELVKAPKIGGLSSWVLGMFMNIEDRYHLGIYLHRDEAVLANLTLPEALYALQAIAYYAPQAVRYKGPDGIVPLTSV